MKQDEKLLDLLPSLFYARRRRIRGQPYCFYSSKDPFFHRPFLVAPMNDMHPNICVCKSRQVGVTETFLGQSAFLAHRFSGITQLYALPRWDQANEWGRDRFDPIVAQTPELRTKTGKWGTGIKTFVHGQDSSRVMFRSAWDPGLGEGTPIDILYLDEYDRMFVGVEDAFKESMKASPLGFYRRFSTPTVEGDGIGKLYNNSDMRKWLMKCNHCGHWQELTFERNTMQVKGDGELKDLLTSGNVMDFDEKTFITCCQKCHKEIVTWEMQGEWVAEKPSRTNLRGYLITQMLCPWITADMLWHDRASMQIEQNFVNYVLGLPYRGSGTSITDDTYKNNMSPVMCPNTRPSEWLKVAIGIDWGKINWYIMMVKIRNIAHPVVVDMGWYEDTPRPLESAEKIADYCKKYKADVIVADAGYGADRNAHMKKKFPGRFWQCRNIDSAYRSYEPQMYPNNPVPELQVGKREAWKHYMEWVYHGGLKFSTKIARHKFETMKKHYRGDVLSQAKDKDRRRRDQEVLSKVDSDHLLWASIYAKYGLMNISGRVSIVEIGGMSSLNSMDNLTGAPPGEWFIKD